MSTNLSTALRWSLFIFLLLCWLFNFPHFQISNFIGERFPFPVDKQLKWSALLLEVSLIEAVVCIPFVFPIVWLCRKYAIQAATLMFLIFTCRVFVTLLFFGTSTYSIVFLIFQTICHLAFVVGGTYLALNYLKKNGNLDLKMAVN
jgi:hypothetical protein